AIHTYGQANSNSTGLPARIAWTGSPSLQANDLVLLAADLPPGVDGIFFYGTAKIDPGVLFGNGLRLVGGAIERLAVVHSSVYGRVSFTVDFTKSPFDSLTSADLRFFQFWFRDPAGGGALFNTTNGL